MDKNIIAEILLVEDLEEDATLCVRSLKKHNLANEIKWVEDGVEALDYLFATGKYAERDVVLTPKIILLDLKLPKISGLEVLKQIKSNQATNKIPVIVMTSSKEDKDIQNAYALGANSYIVKPVEFKNFSVVVKEIGHYWLLVNQNI